MNSVRIALCIQYDGSPWQGWQSQPHQQSIQDQLQAAIFSFSQETCVLTCAGRTDAGVHALRQIAHFDSTKNRPMISWVRGLNAYLPKSIAIRWAHDVSCRDIAHETFHARYCATARTYQYLLYNHPVRSPLLAQRAGWFFRPLDVSRMIEAAQALIGKHDFSAFRAAQCQAKSPYKHIHEISIHQHGSYILFTLKADAFLHHMVRNIIGSLIFVGSNRRPINWVSELLLRRDRSLAAPTFMPDGLYLIKVDYDSIWGLPQDSDNRLNDMFWVQNKFLNTSEVL